MVQEVRQLNGKICCDTIHHNRHHWAASSRHLLLQVIVLLFDGIQCITNYRKIAAIGFVQSTTFNSAIKWNVAKNITYPKLTVCHPRFFDKNKMKGNNFV
jgi:hypothetical protein